MPEEIIKACEYPHLAKGGGGCPYKKGCPCPTQKAGYSPPGYDSRGIGSVPGPGVRKADDLSALDLVKASRAPSPSRGGGERPGGGGWATIPRGKHGGYRRKKGAGYEYWYPGDSSRPGAKSPVSTSKPQQYREELKEYNLEIVAGADHKLGPDDIKRAQEIVRKVKAGIEKSADVCKLSPPVCADNKGIPRSQMPQITETSIKTMKSAMGDAEYNGWMKKGGWSAVNKKAAEGGGKGADKQSVPGLEPGKDDKQFDAADRFEARMKADAAVAVGGDPYTDKSVMDMFLDKLSRQGIKSKTEKVPVGRLKATQKEIKAGKTYGMADAFLKGKFRPQDDEILISSDGYILDGHHRYAALITAQPDILMNVKRVDMNMDDFLVASFKMQGVFRADIQGAVVDPKTPHDLSGSSTKKSLTAWAQANPEAARRIIRKARGGNTFQVGGVTYHEVVDHGNDLGDHPANRSLLKAEEPELISFGESEPVDFDSLCRVDGVLMPPNGFDRRS